MVQGSSRAPAWSSHKISKAEIDQLQRCFSKVLELLGSVLEDSHRRWEGVAVIFRSLGRWVSLVGVSKEAWTRLKLDNDPEVFPVGEDHIVLHLSSAGDCARVKEGGPWFIGGQLMALDSWESDFIPSRKSIFKTVVWMRLPELPLEY